MSKGKGIFQAVCDAPEAKAAVASLKPKHWQQLYSYLLLSYEENGVSGEVLGIMLVEGARRYAASLPAKLQHEGKPRIL